LRGDLDAAISTRGDLDVQAISTRIVNQQSLVISFWL